LPFPAKQTLKPGSSDKKAIFEVVLGDDVFISVLEVSGQTVRLGIDAPRSVRVYREEIWTAVRAENEAAATATELPPAPRSRMRPGRR